MEIYGAPLARGASGRGAAYALLAHAFRETYGGAMPPIARAAGGKPFFLQSGVHFSLSHTRSAVYCAVGLQPVGLDAETIRPVRRRVAERTMNPPELVWLAEQPDWDTAFLTLWTAKEAWSKLTGRGLQWQPKAIALTVDPLAVAGQSAVLAACTDHGSVVTVCTERPEPLRWHWASALSR